MCISAYKGQRKMSHPLELELQAVMNHPVWAVLGTDLGSSARTASILNH